MRVLITGAAGNLGNLLTQHILQNSSDLELVLMQHHTEITPDIRAHPQTDVRMADLAKPASLDHCLDGVDVIVHFAGVLFRANPEKFLYQTNIGYFKNLVAAAKQRKIPKVILISFPHVEGPTSRLNPATGRLDGHPVSVHAQTRLQEEKHLFREIDIPIALRVGMVYGKGVLMVDAAKWFAQYRLLGIWREPTPIHLISKSDFCRGVVAAISNTMANGIYHVGDEGQDTLQSFLDWACDVWDLSRPRRLPLPIIYAAADMFEGVSRIFGTQSPLTRDFIEIGRVSYYGDTLRFRQELLPKLRYRNCFEGIEEMLT